MKKMKKVIFFFIIGIALLSFNACSKSKTEAPVAAKCAVKTCFPVDSWKLRYQSGSLGCMDCHTTCSTKKHGCEPGAAWNKTNATCMACHNGSIAPKH